MGVARIDEAYLLATARYLELNPVRAKLVERAEDWRWSSARARLSTS
jgi:putative transposase